MRLTLEITIVVASLLLVLLVLLHRGKGGGLSSLFGGGVQSSLAGSTQAERNLNRITIFVCLVWLIAIVGVSYQIKLKTEKEDRDIRDSIPAVDSPLGGGAPALPGGGAPGGVIPPPPGVPPAQAPAPQAPQPAH